ncbi:MAG: gamma-glutamyltransferase, partial [Oscillospiraceae bacterium]|nr:gamma-glutamyltransferase [Oscillospiraceae bacterium]
METVFNPTYQRYPSQRYPIYANNGMVNTSSPQAAAAGLEVLKRGGNAMDAAVATAAALTVVEPTANGIGSDAFALVWSAKEQKLYGLNFSGPAPMAASIDAILGDKKDKEGKMPVYGW